MKIWEITNQQLKSTRSRTSSLDPNADSHMRLSHGKQLMFEKAHNKNYWKKHLLRGQAHCLSSPRQTETIANDTDEFSPCVLVPSKKGCNAISWEVHCSHGTVWNLWQCQDFIIAPCSLPETQACFEYVTLWEGGLKKFSCRIFPSASFFRVLFLVFSLLWYLLAKAAPFMEFNKWCLPSEQFDSSSNYSNKLLSSNIIWVFHYFKLLSSELITETVDLFWEASSCKFPPF